MKKLIIIILVSTISLTGLLAQETAENYFKSYWKNGYVVESTDKQFKMKFGGRIMYDVAFFFQDDTLADTFGALNNGTEFRRARFFNSGQIYNNIKYKIQLDFAGGKISFKDVYMMITKIPAVGNLKIGHFKEPFRLEALTSSKYITFMERGLPISMSTERNTGFLIQNSFLKSRLSYQAGVFRGADSFGNDKKADDGYVITARLSGLPINNTEKKQLLHLGVAYSYRRPETKEYKISAKPENHLGYKYASTGTISDVDVVAHLGTEAAFVLGPFSIQGELVKSTINTKTDTFSNSYSFTGYYGQVSFFLTGESRKYKNYEVGFGRVSPKNNFGNGEGGLGAWEVALRYSGLDLIDGKSADNSLIDGGMLNDLTIGVNWYLNPATRIMVNYVMASLKNVDLTTTNDAVNSVGNEGTFQIRFQIDF